MRSRTKKDAAGRDGRATVLALLTMSARRAAAQIGKGVSRSSLASRIIAGVSTARSSNLKWH